MEVAKYFSVFDVDDQNVQVIGEHSDSSVAQVKRRYSNRLRFLIGRDPNECRDCARRWQSGQTVHHRVGHTCSTTRGKGSHFGDSGSRGGGGGSKRPLDRSWRDHEWRGYERGGRDWS